MADYTQPKDVEKRLRYFNGQFLREQDFIDEQKYHLDRQRRHQRLFHAPGIAEGLAVTAASSGASVTVAPGTAVDARGQALVLAATETVSLAGALGTTRRLVLGYRALETDQSQTGSISYTRFHEKPELAVLTLDDALQDRVVLARLTITAAGAVTVDPSERQYAGVLLPGGGTLRIGATGKLDASAGLRVTGDSELTGGLTVSGSLGVGTTAPQERQQIGTAFAFHDGQTAKVLAFGYAPSASRALQTGIPAEIRWDPAAGTLQLGTDTSSRAANASGVAIPTTLTIKQGNVGIGTASPATRLEVVGDWANDEGALRLTGDRPTIRFQAGATAGNESWLLHVSGTGPGNFELHRRAGTVWAAQLSVTTGGNLGLGLGSTSASARLSVAAAGASELTGSARSTTLLTSSGALGTTVNSELALASFGFGSGNASSLGLRAVRATAGTSWESAAIGLGMDVDNTVRAGATLWLHANKNVGLGTSAPNKSLHIQQSGSTVPLLTEERRPGIAIAGEYPDLTLFSGVNNGSHGPTIRLGSYNDDTRQTSKHWVIGTAGRNAAFLDFGFGSNDANPHNGIRSYLGRTVMTLTENGNVGIGTLGPATALHIPDRGIQIGTSGTATDNFHIVSDTNGARALRVYNGNYGAATSMPISIFQNGDISLSNKHAFRSNDAWLRLNQDGAFGSGVHTPGLFAPGSVNVGGAGGYGNPGGGNTWIAGRLSIGTTSLRESLVVAGNTVVEGLLGVGGFSPYPRHSGWGGGIHTFDLEAEGTIWCNNDILTRTVFRSNQSDLAENYRSEHALEPGEVVALDPEHDQIVRSTRPNDPLLFGVVSTEPGMLLNSDIDLLDERLFPVALSGRVPCKVTDENGPIRRGDLLTSSSTPGHAMKARPTEGTGYVQPGTIIGKALAAHRSGQGLIDIFVTLS